MSIYTNVFSYYIWSFKACLTYQLLNSTLYIMVSWNAERVHNVHVGDNAFFLFIIFVDGFLVWYPCGIYCKHTMALFWLEKKKMLPQKATHPWVAILPSAHKFWFLYSLFNKLQKFYPSHWASLGLADGPLPVTWQLAGRMCGSHRNAESVHLCWQQQLNKVKWGRKGKEDSFRTPLSRFSVILLTNTKTVGK